MELILTHAIVKLVTQVTTVKSIQMTVMEFSAQATVLVKTGSTRLRVFVMLDTAEQLALKTSTIAMESLAATRARALTALMSTLAIATPDSRVPIARRM